MSPWLSFCVVAVLSTSSTSCTFFSASSFCPAWARLLAMVASTTVLISRSVVPTKEAKASERSESALLSWPMRVYILPSWNLRKRASHALFTSPPLLLAPVLAPFSRSLVTFSASSSARTAVALSPSYSIIIIMRNI
jgi:hypothetical protein